MKVLVTGSNGFVGTALCREMQRRGMALRALQRADIGSIGAHTDWRSALDGCDTVIHLAAQAHRPAGKSAQELSALRSTNVDGVLNLARQSAATGVRRFVFLSSIKAWGERTAPGHAARELDTCHPEDAYGQSKWEAEKGLVAFARELEIVIVRSPLVYGPQAKGNFAALARAVLRGWPLPLGAVHNARSMVALDNLVDFLICCAFHPGAVNQTFHVSDDDDLSAAALVRAIATAAGVTPRLFSVPPSWLRFAARLIGRDDAAQRLLGNLQVDISRARDLLQWKPGVSVQEGMRRALAPVEPT